MKERVLDTRGKADDGDARNILSKKKQDVVMTPGYHTRRGGRYDSREDRSPTLKPPRTCVFSQEIHAAPIPQHF